MDFTIAWGDDACTFVLKGKHGVVVLRAHKVLNEGVEEWHCQDAGIHKPLSSPPAAAGYCMYVQGGSCAYTHIDKKRVLVPLIKWQQHQHNHAIIENVMKKWYDEIAVTHEQSRDEGGGAGA